MSLIIGHGRYGRLTYPGRSSAAPSALASPLTAEFWVDSSSTVTPRTGSILAPFNSLQEAYDAAVAASLGAVNIIVARSEAVASLVCGSPVFCSVIALTGPLAPISVLAHHQQVDDVTVTDGALFIQGMLINGDIGSSGPTVTLDNCVHLGDVTAPTADFILKFTILCGAGGSLSCNSIDFTDEFSERRTSSTSTGAWAANTLIQSNAGGPNDAIVLIDADEPSESFTVSSRRVLPNQTLTAARSITLTVSGGGEFATGYVDVYEQSFDLQIFDSVGPALLTTVSAGTDPRRYGYQLPDATSWINFRSESLL